MTYHSRDFGDRYKVRANWVCFCFCSEQGDFFSENLVPSTIMNRTEKLRTRISLFLFPEFKDCSGRASEREEKLDERKRWGTIM